jgi:putative copper export protein
MTVVAVLLVATVATFVLAQLNADERLLLLSRYSLFGVMIVALLPLVGVLVLTCFASIKRSFRGKRPSRGALTEEERERSDDRP